MLFTLDQSDAGRVYLVQADRKLGSRNSDERNTLTDLTLLVRVNQRRDWSRCEQTVVSSSVMKEVQNTYLALASDL